MSVTGIKSTSFHVWAASFLTGLGAEVYAVTGHHLSAAALGFGVQAIAGFVKTWHDHGLRTAAIAAGRDLEKVAPIIVDDITKIA